jgi:hypothetical protein
MTSMAEAAARRPLLLPLPWTVPSPKAGDRDPELAHRALDLVEVEFFGGACERSVEGLVRGIEVGRDVRRPNVAELTIRHVEVVTHRSTRSTYGRAVEGSP